MLSKENDDAFGIVVVLAVEFFTEIIEANVLLAIGSEVKTVNINIIIIIVVDADRYNEMVDIGLLILKAV